MSGGAAPLPDPDVLRERVAGSPLVVMLDVDGTLAPIAPRPEAAAVPETTRTALASLVRSSDVHLAVVTGRSAADALRLVGVEGVWVIGNHGCEVVSPAGVVTVDERAAPYGTAMADAAAALAPLTAAVPGVVLEDKVWTLSVHYRLADPSAAPRVRRAVEAVASEHGFRLTTGKLVLELRPPVDVDKGTAVLTLARWLGGLGDGASLIFAGDDRTDEDAMVLLRRHAAFALTIHVRAPEGEGSLATAAEYEVRGPEAMGDFLRWLASVRRPAGVATTTQ